QHATHLLLEDSRLMQASIIGLRAELVVRSAAPQKIRQPRGKLIVVNRMRASGLRIAVELDPIDERGRDQHRLQRQLHSHFGQITLLSGDVGERDVSIKLVARGRTAPRAPRESRQNLPTAPWIPVWVADADAVWATGGGIAIPSGVDQRLCRSLILFH